MGNRNRSFKKGLVLTALFSGMLISAGTGGQVRAEEASVKEETEFAQESTLADTEAVAAVTNPDISFDGEKGWSTEGSDTYYYLEGKKVKKQVLEIGGKLYAFDGDGALIREEEVYLYTGEVAFYGRAKKDGVLFRSEWYDDSEEFDSQGLRYYYGADGRGATGISKVGKVAYLFNERGRLLVGEGAKVSGKWYAGDEEGHPVELTGPGWKQVGGAWFYVEASGEPVCSRIRRINNRYYGFSSSGAMRESCSFFAYDETGSSWNSYRARESGELYISAWYSDGDDWYYYGADGVSCTGYQVIGKKAYIFNDAGRMVAGTVVTVKTGDAQGTYYCDAEGNPTPVKEGWNKIGSGYFYIENGKALKKTVKEIKGKLYGFDDAGRMYAGTGFTLDTPKLSSYYAGTDGALYRNKWLKRDADWFYFGEDGGAYTGIREVSGKAYAFNTKRYLAEGEMFGKLLTNTTFTDADDNLWLVDGQGYAVMVPEEGWIKSGGKWYYSADGALVKGGVRKLGEAWYGFDLDGVLYTNRRFCYNLQYYRSTDGSGKLLTSTWYKNEYYDQEGKSPSDGITKVSGVPYYFREGVAVSNEFIFSEEDNCLYHADAACRLKDISADGRYELYDEDGYVRSYLVEKGQLVRGQWRKLGGYDYYFTEEGYACTGSCLYNGKYYYFQQDGRMLSGGWRYTSGGKVYLQSNGAALTGIQKLGDKRYYFDARGILKTGPVWVKGEIYLCRSDGSYVGKINSEGATRLDGNTYYAQNGMLCQGVHIIGGKEYYFEEEGVSCYALKKNFIRDRFVYGEDGARITSGWARLGGDWYYINPSTGMYATGCVTVDGKKYYFSPTTGIMQTSRTIRDQVTLLTVNAKGVVTREERLPEGWSLTEDTWRYRPSENVTPDFWVGDNSVNNYTYELNACKVVGGYYIGPEGKRIRKTGWQKVVCHQPANWYGPAEDYVEWYYVKPDQLAAVDEWLKLGGYWYRFDEWGRMRSYPFMEDGNLYLTDASGRLLETVKHTDDGWYAFQGSYIYVFGGRLVSRQFVVQGKVYTTENTGQVMSKNRVGAEKSHELSMALYYHGNNGASVKKAAGWFKEGGKWFYAGTDGKLLNRWFTVDGKTYYCRGTEGIVTGWQIIDRRLYHFNGGGALDEEVVCSNGWLKKGTSWYYFENGFLTDKNKLCLANKTYLLKDGRMLSNELQYNEYFTCYADGNGLMVKKAWKKVGGHWYYFDAEGLMVTGVRTINGKLYGFNRYGQLQ